MLRFSHSWAGLVISLGLLVLAVTGVLLSFNPMLERFQANQPAKHQISVAELVDNISQTHSSIDQIERTPNGAILVYYTDQDQPMADYVDATTGLSIAPYEPSSWQRWLKDFHRAFLLGDAGRLMSGFSALVLFMLALTGIFLLASYLGGWQKLVQPSRGRLSQRLHIDLSRIAIIGLLLSSFTGMYLTAVNFEWIPVSQSSDAPYPTETSEKAALPIAELRTLQKTDINDLRQLVFPFQDDPNDVYTLQTSHGAGYIDQGTGELLNYQAHSAGQTFYEWMYKLHTGQGLWWFGLIMGLFSLTIPILTVTGIFMWWHRQRSKPRIPNNATAGKAETIILVGSQGNATWAFAKTLHMELARHGVSVHTTSMNQLARHYDSAKQIIVLTSTYGDGDAPASANQFLTRIQNFRASHSCQYTVLGFGDRQFSHFCAFAETVDTALSKTNMSQLLPMTTINQQSAQGFHQWGELLAEHIGHPIRLEHNAKAPQTTPWLLISRTDYGDEESATAVLRFARAYNRSPSGTAKQLPNFSAGDLIGINAPNTRVPRYYSLASSTRDGYLEICVRKHPNGVCSNFLHALKIGDSIDAFIQANPSFRPQKYKAPVILIGAGTGIGPLAGFIRQNNKQQPMHLYWGGRHPDRDFLYQQDLNHYLDDKRLTDFKPAFSRHDDRAYVQDRLRADQLLMRQLIESGAQVLVCGGREMAHSVRLVFDEILAPLNTNVANLKTKGRFLEDVY